MPKVNLRVILIVLAIIILGAAVFGGGALVNKYFPQKTSPLVVNSTVTSEEANVINIIEKSSPSVVTVSGTTPRRATIEFSPFGGFNRGMTGGQQQDIGSGFIVSSDGLIVTNKHVVSDTSITYKVVTSDNKEYNVEKISRDPNNDIAILKINVNGLTPITLGDSSNLKAGQTVIAIGTALGQFRHTVTKGVISGLGRGIEAGDPYQGYVEQLDNIIQTDAAINPGNSGGPLINSTGAVIGINVAVAENAQSVGFAIPINVVKEALSQFNKTGSFPAKPFLGVQYQMVSMQTAILNNVPRGAYVTNILANSAAEKAGVQVGDIITKIDGQNINDSGLAKFISNKKVGDSMKLEIWRDGQTVNLTAILTEANK